MNNIPKVEIDHLHKVWRIHLNGERITMTELAKILNTERELLRRRLAPMKAENRASFIQDLFWRKERGIPNTATVYEDPEGNRCVISCIQKEWPTMHHSTIYRRMRMWSRGEIDIDKLFEPPIDKERISKITAARKKKSPSQWCGLKGARDIKSRKQPHEIPGPTLIERQLYGY